MTQEYIKTLRKVIKVGKSLYINIPLNFVKRHGISEGDKLLLHGNNDLRITIIDKPDES